MLVGSCKQTIFMDISNTQQNRIHDEAILPDRHNSLWSRTIKLLTGPGKLLKSKSLLYPQIYELDHSPAENNQYGK